MTDDEFFRLPPDPDGMRMELVCGRVVLAPPPVFEHGHRSSGIAYFIEDFVRQHELGVVTTGSGFSYTPDRRNVRAPDVAFISHERLAAVTIREEGYTLLAPDLCVEVLSPGNTPRAVDEKVALYLSSGVRRVWVVEPKPRTVTVHRPGTLPELLRMGDGLTSEHAAFAVEGFALPLAVVFAAL